MDMIGAIKQRLADPSNANWRQDLGLYNSLLKQEENQEHLRWKRDMEKQMFERKFREQDEERKRKQQERQFPKPGANALAPVVGGKEFVSAGSFTGSDGQTVPVPKAGTVTDNIYTKLNAYTHGDTNAPTEEQFTYKTPNINNMGLAGLNALAGNLATTQAMDNQGETARKNNLALIANAINAVNKKDYRDSNPMLSSQIAVNKSRAEVNKAKRNYYLTKDKNKPKDEKKPPSNFLSMISAKDRMNMYLKHMQNMMSIADAEGNAKYGYGDAKYEKINNDAQKSFGIGPYAPEIKGNRFGQNNSNSRLTGSKEPKLNYEAINKKKNSKEIIQMAEDAQKRGWTTIAATLRKMAKEKGNKNVSIR